ncbi:UTP--glucose-1-phosphate uridylyltransferase [Tetrabaena socialis]|uniref:UTP--glucose-1-phosphate uridylyltransferase n=1 Tax=Tetrabaena socialis TaxID=47790 RepID=A0A2J8ADJ1_9CHLO|nr:UTP--glucose-1-phosphate uridylyltransferase [Tetrabaena socialis]|eukprot:PNH10583.1 UTP--glucose-1-phosphate uridylyltransferase [Tetrabaena socialis]
MVLTSSATHAVTPDSASAAASGPAASTASTSAARAVTYSANADAPLTATCCPTARPPPRPSRRRAAPAPAPAPAVAAAAAAAGGSAAGPSATTTPTPSAPSGKLCTERRGAANEGRICARSAACCGEHQGLEQGATTNSRSEASAWARAGGAVVVKHMRLSYGSNVLFTLMNSFSTSADTRAFLQEKHPELLEEPFIELMQNMSPKVDAASSAPASHPEQPDMEWCPPGHGDIYPSLLGSGMLARYVAAGIKYLFVSNSDNLGATLDLDLLSYFASSGKAFIMETVGCGDSGLDAQLSLFVDLNPPSHHTSRTSIHSAAAAARVMPS